jgi:hypothetical protein
MVRGQNALGLGEWKVDNVRLHGGPPRRCCRHGLSVRKDALLNDSVNSTGPGM